MQKPKDLLQRQLEEREKAQEQKKRQAETCNHIWYEVPGPKMLMVFNCHNCPASKYE